MRRIHHVGIVVTRLEEAYRFYRDTLAETAASFAGEHYQQIA